MVVGHSVYPKDVSKKLGLYHIVTASEAKFIAKIIENVVKAVPTVKEVMGVGSGRGYAEALIAKHITPLTSVSITASTMKSGMEWFMTYSKPSFMEVANRAICDIHLSENKIIYCCWPFKDMLDDLMRLLRECKSQVPVFIITGERDCGCCINKAFAEGVLLLDYKILTFNTAGWCFNDHPDVISGLAMTVTTVIFNPTLISEEQLRNELPIELLHDVPEPSDQDWFGLQCVVDNLHDMKMKCMTRR